MKEYIEKDAALNMVCYTCCFEPSSCGPKCADYLCIKEIPSADVKPVVRGAWEIIDRDELGERLFSCPLCGGSVWRFTAPNYCLNCGADMQKWAQEHPEGAEEE